ncbi:regulatory protein, luxR family [Thermomonospora echinospora]|uniref:Regulatory protein, luxR family n=1 Tax=Thermomonospora echinospora TaxID=1992 RepID=A0A1H6CAP7_9ACTN|nr:helix-turn-helix transcriptional regulator [Thermomonospora echinospora]SEG69725.1 regulatory protein, luxR family [Thermomonospora echinospora]
MPPDSLLAPPPAPETAATTATAPEPVAAHRPVLHGRDEELAELRDLVSRTRRGRGGALAIVGGPGLGKTALLDAAAGEAGPDFRVIGTRGVRGEARFALAGLHRMLRPVAAWLDRLPAEQAAALAFLTDAGAEPPAEPFALCRAVYGLLSELGRDGPLLCRIDDAHWLDRPSLEALTFAARRLTAQPVLVLFASRSERGAYAELDCLADIRSLRLGPVGAGDALAVLRDRTAGCCGDTATELLELAAGNPLALVELAAELTPEQLAGQAPPPAALPRRSRMRTHYRRRLYRLPPGARALVLLAVVDDRLELDTLTRAATEAGIDLAEWETARSSGLVRVDGEAVRVRDPLVRGCLYADAALNERHAAHRLLARVLDRPWHRLRRDLHRAAAAEGPDPALADELCAGAAQAAAAGNHHDAARAWRRAATLTPDPATRADRLLAAAEDFWQAGRPHTARMLLRQARPLIRSPWPAGRADRLLGEIELRAGQPAVAGRLLLEAADRLAEPHGGLALAALMSAAEAADLSGDLHAQRRAARLAAGLRHPAGHPVTELMAAHIAGMTATVHGDHEQAGQSLRRVVELGGASPDPVAKVWGSVAAITLGRDLRAYELAVQAVHGSRRSGATALLPWSLVTLSLVECLLGRFHAALADSAEGLRLARAAGQDNCAVDHLALMALVSAFQGDREATASHLAAVAEPISTRGLSRPATVASWALACLKLADDRPADAAARLRLRTVTGAQHRTIRVLAAPYFVEAAVRSDQRRQAVQALETYERWAEGTRSPGRLALAHRCRALLAGCDEAAVAHFEEALRLHSSAESAFELARTALLYGHRLRRGRRPRAARDHLRDALQIFTEYGAERWAERARAELRAAGETVEPAARDCAPAGLDELTPQQLQIARLVAEGATNREIAAQLTLSPRTIEHHLRNIFTRLDIRSRVELTMLLR